MVTMILNKSIKISFFLACTQAKRDLEKMMHSFVHNATRRGKLSRNLESGQFLMFLSFISKDFVTRPDPPTNWIPWLNFLWKVLT